MNLLKEIENEQIAKLTAGKEIPEFQPGDTVVVNVNIIEGERRRVQAYEGVCIGRAGFVTFPSLVVTPGRLSGAGPESITTVGGYGFRTRGLCPRSGMTGGPKVGPALAG